VRRFKRSGTPAHVIKPSTTLSALIPGVAAERITGRYAPRSVLLTALQAVTGYIPLEAHASERSASVPMIASVT